MEQPSPILWSPARSSRCSPMVSLATGSAIWPAATAGKSSACQTLGRTLRPAGGPRIHPSRTSRVVAFVQAETSTGLYNQGQGICEAAHEVDALTIADCVTSLGGMPVLVDETGSTSRIVVRRKARLPSGSAPLTVSPRALDLNAQDAGAIFLSGPTVAGYVLHRPQISSHGVGHHVLRAARRARHRRGGRPGGPLGAPQGAITRRLSPASRPWG